MRQTKRTYAVAGGARGFTLLELILSLALSMLLVVGIFSSLYSYYFLRDAGERQVDEGRNWVAFTQRMQQDLARLSSSADSDTAVDSGAKPVNGPLSQVSERVLDFGFAFSLDPFAIYGEEDFLALGNLIPKSTLSGGDRGGTPLVHHAVVWASADQSLMKIPYQDSSGQTAFRSFTLPQKASSMTRNERRLQRAVVALSAQPELTERAVYDVPAQAVRFRYFDGLVWQKQWDSARMGSLPQAIEVELVSPLDQTANRLRIRLPGARADVARRNLASVAGFGSIADSFLQPRQSRETARQNP